MSDSQNPTITSSPGGDEAVGQIFGRYKLLEKLGEGGFGAVWLAEQKAPVRRKVALKIIKLGMDTKAVVARFEAERQALALMDHPNIAKVLDAGATDSGRPYFVMELVRGIKITEYCDQNHVPTRERLDLFIKVCQAIQHAHQKGIIHRDIKPSNILVTLHDGAPVPKVIDFGIAKATQGELTDKTIHTQFQQFIGTPAYMSPEQAEMSGLDIDTRSDIYSLGVLLYELLTGRTPFDAKELMSQGIDAMRKTIREQEPVRPSTKLATLSDAERTAAAKQHATNFPALIHLLKGDLDWIVVKSIEKDRARRYETANGLAADVRRHLNNEPIIARAPSASYRLQKSIRRNRVLYTSGAAVTLALVLGFCVSTWQAVRASRAEREQSKLRLDAEAAKTREAALRLQAETERTAAELAKADEAKLRNFAEVQAYAADMKAAQAAFAQNSRGQAVELLERHRPAPGKGDLRDIEWRYLWGQAHGDQDYTWKHPSMVVGAVFSPDSRTVVTACHDGFLRVWDVSSRNLVGQFYRGVRDEGFFGSLCFSPDGKTLFAADNKGFILIDTQNWQFSRRLEDPTGTPETWDGSTALAFDHGGKRAAAATKSGVRIWDLVNGNSVLLHPIGNDNARNLAFTADDQSLMVSNNGFLELWNPETGSKIAQPHGYVAAFALSPDGDRLLLTRWDGAIELLSMSSGAILWTNRWHKTSVLALSFSPDGALVADGAYDQTINLIDAATGTLSRALRGHLNEVWSVQFSRDGRWLISSSKDATARLWDLRRTSQSQLWLPARQYLGFLGCAAHGKQIVTRDVTNGVVYFWAGTNIVRSIENLPKGQLLLSPDGTRFVLQNEKKPAELAIYDEMGLRTTTVTVRDAKRFDPRTISQDNRLLLLSLSFDKSSHRLAVLDIASGQITHQLGVAKTDTQGHGDCVFSHNGELVAWSGTNYDAQVWSLRSGQLLHTFKGHLWHINSVAFSPDDSILATSSWDGEARLWDVKTGKMLAQPLRGHGSGIPALTFAPSGKTLITAGDDNTVRFWNVATGREMLLLQNSNAAGRDLLSRDGDQLILWDTARHCLRLERIPSSTEIAADRSESSDVALSPKRVDEEHVAR